MQTLGARAYPPLLVLAALVVAADQITKAIALNTLEPGEQVRALDGVLMWTLQRNPGAAFGLFQRFPAVFTILASVISVGVLAFARRIPDKLHAVAFGLVLGGALGNLIDRIARAPGFPNGLVVDFIKLPNWPVFNLADSSIVIGAGVLIIAAGRADRRAKRDADAPPA